MLTYDLKDTNKAVLNGTIKAMIDDYEKAFDARIQKTAEDIASDIAGHGIVMVSGPSSSGKTTFSLKLCEDIRKTGKEALLISLDDFFIDRDKMPMKEDGTPDFESVYAMDLPHIDECILELLNDRKSLFPKFNFLTGKLTKRCREVNLTDNTIVLIEGLHALNNLITDPLPQNLMKKIYVSIESDLHLNGELFLRNTDIRFLRRLVRDFKHRGASSYRTFTMWDEVLVGDKKYVFPFMDKADIRFNTFFSYDTGILKNQAIPLLEEIKEDTHYHAQARNLIERLQEIESMDVELLPNTSLILEFAGESIYYD